MESAPKKVMFLMRKAPHGSIYSLAGLEAILIMGAYEQDVCVVFIDDGVYALKKDQDTSEAGVREFSRTFRALKDHDVEKIYVDKDSMQSRGLSLDDLIIKPEVVEVSDIVKLMDEQDVILPF